MSETIRLVLKNNQHGYVGYNNISYFYKYIDLPIESRNYSKDDIILAVANKYPNSTIDVSDMVFESITSNNSNFIDCINLKGLTFVLPNNFMGYDNANGNTNSIIGIPKVKKLKGVNIDIDHGLIFNVRGLEELYGHIKVNGKDDVPGSGGEIKFYWTVSSLRYAAGSLTLKNISKIHLMVDTGTSPNPLGYNFLDLRNVDFSQCTEVSFLSGYNDECTIIFGDCSNDNVTSYADACFSSAPKTGRYAVMTYNNPPILKNCKFENGVAINQHDDLFDWIKKAKFRRIRVPKDSIELYRNNTYIPGGTVGKTGWSYYGPAGVEFGGEDIIEPYDPETEYVAKEKWIYTAVNWRQE